MSQKKYGRRYDAQLKEEAVKLLLSSGKSLYCTQTNGSLALCFSMRMANG